MPKIRRAVPKLRADALASPLSGLTKDDSSQPVLHEKAGDKAIVSKGSSWADQPAKLTKKEKRLLKAKTFLESVTSSSTVTKPIKQTKKEAVGLLTLSEDIGSALPSETELNLARVKNAISNIVGTVARDAARDAAARGGTMSQDQRMKVKAAEKEQMRLVLSHPTFQANPMSAVREHMVKELAMQKQAHILKRQVLKEKEKVNKLPTFTAPNKSNVKNKPNLQKPMKMK